MLAGFFSRIREKVEILILELEGFSSVEQNQAQLLLLVKALSFLLTGGCY